MTIKLWNKTDIIFDGILDPVYRDLDYCQLYYIEEKAFLILNRQPQYPLYKRMGIPEIQDVFVLPDYRRQGLAKQLITHCEMTITETMIGICVSVSPQFGNAQCLYASMGYRPDGNGVTYERQPVIHGASYHVDDQLCMMLIKDLQQSQADIITMGS